MGGKFSLIDLFIWAVFAVGVHIHAETYRQMIASCRLFPLPQLRRWMRKHRLLNRPSLLWAVVWIGVFLIAERVINISSVLMKLVIAVGSDPTLSRLYLLGTVLLGVCLRHGIANPAQPDHLPGAIAGPFIEGE